ncbi:hypothetical protein [Duganella sp. P38]|uniref:hypothetical protein n=1 Tax=Duganella sp. P38 TaxID=3423949 RepID=UPI003D7A0443
MALESIAATGSTALQQTAPTRQPEQVRPVDRPAERVEQAAPPPPQAAVAPTVNTSGQRIGTTISTSA